MIGKNTERHSREIKVSVILLIKTFDWRLVKGFPDDIFTGISPYIVFLALGFRIALG